MLTSQQLVGIAYFLAYGFLQVDKSGHGMKLVNEIDKYGR